jgi:hypothetical protein
MALYIGRDGQVERRPYDGFTAIPRSHRRKLGKGPFPRKPRKKPERIDVAEIGRKQREWRERMQREKKFGWKRHPVSGNRIWAGKSPTKPGRGNYPRKPRKPRPSPVDHCGIEVYPRDASWRNSTGLSSKFHWPSPDDAGLSACGRNVLHYQMGRYPCKVSEGDRCAASGCRQRWAKWAR